jgi:hypothetical protein
MARRDATEVLNNARKVFKTASLGLADLESADPTRRVAGLHNVIVFGRSVTFILQNLRTVDAAAFDAWYAPYLAEMKADPLLLHFNKLRTELVHEGGAGTTGSITFGSDPVDLAALMANPPPGATRFFMGDAGNMGIGWEVALPDGSTTKYYVTLPANAQIETAMHLPDAPSGHLGKPIGDQTAPALARLYLDYIGRLLANADAHFGAPK